MSKETTKQENEQASATQLSVFSPYRIKHFETVKKPVTIKQGDRKGQTFESTSHVLTISPQMNPELLIDVTVFDRDFQRMKALALLNGGFNKCWFRATEDTSKQRQTNIYTAFAG